MVNSSHYERIVIDRYHYAGHHECESWCQLEILPLDDGTVVIATEVKENPGTSITNRAEYLAYQVCVEFGIDPLTLVWIEVYGYAQQGGSSVPGTYDLVCFQIVVNSNEAVFAHPVWRAMRRSDWQALGLEAR